MNERVFTVDTPDGPFTVIHREDAVLAAGWTTEPRDLLPLISPRLRPASLEHSAGRNAGSGAAADAVTAYYDGDLSAPAAVPVIQASGPFRQRAWDALRLTAPGQPLTYAGFAGLAGRPLAVRAAAGACASNAAALFVPCHRVVRTDGSLGGFRWGTAVKESLLRREAAAEATVSGLRLSAPVPA